jgi:pimeloyl-ACP methyl ester carboxylesterase
MYEDFLYILNIIIGVFFWIILITFFLLLLLLLLICALINFIYEYLINFFQINNNISYTKSTDLLNELSYCVKKYNLTERWIQNKNKLNIHLVEKKSNKDNCKNVIFINGACSCSFIFFNLISELPKENNYYAIDLPNFGISSYVNLDNLDNIEICNYYADLIYNIITKELKLSKIILVAHSFGGFLSTYMTYKYTELVEDLVLLNSVGFLPILNIYSYYWSIFFYFGFPKNLLNTQISHFLLRPLTNLEIFNNDSKNKFWKLYLMNIEYNYQVSNIISRFISLGFFSSIWKTPIADLFYQLKCKVYLWYGKRDTIVPFHQGLIFCDKNNKNHNYKVFHDSGHNPIHSKKFKKIFIRDVLKNKNKFNNDIKYSKYKIKKIKDIINNNKFNSFLILEITRNNIKKIYDEINKIF